MQSNKKNLLMKDPCVIEHKVTRVLYYFDTHLQALFSGIASDCFPPQPWDLRDSRWAVYDQSTHEVVWLNKPGDLSPQGMVMAAAIGKYALMPQAESYQVM